MAKIGLPQGKSDLDLNSPEACTQLIEESSSYAKPLMVVYLLCNGKITEEQAIGKLANIYSSDPVAMGHTNMRMAVTYVGYRRFMERRSGTPRVGVQKVEG